MVNENHGLFTYLVAMIALFDSNCFIKACILIIIIQPIFLINVLVFYLMHSATYLVIYMSIFLVGRTTCPLLINLANGKVVIKRNGKKCITLALLYSLLIKGENVLICR